MFTNAIAYQIANNTHVQKFKAIVVPGLDVSKYGAGAYFVLDQDHFSEFKDQLGKEVDELQTLYIYTIALSGRFFNEHDIVKETGKTVFDTYRSLLDELQDPLKASKEMVARYGIVGAEFNSPEDGHSVVVYDPGTKPDPIKILDIQKL